MLIENGTASIQRQETSSSISNTGLMSITKDMKKSEGGRFLANLELCDQA